MKRPRPRLLQSGLLCLITVLVTGAALSSHAVTVTNDRSYISFPSTNMTAYSTGFDYGTYMGDMAQDSDNNLHLVSSVNVGHLGRAQYRRWSHATTNWSGAVVSLEYGGGTDDNEYIITTVDDADRVHVVYHHGTNNANWQVYHAWCTNATGSTPLTLGNWTKTQISPTVPAQLESGSLISVGSNLLLYARGNADAGGDSERDIRIDRADWNGSAWVWSSMGAVIVGDSTTSLTMPVLTYDDLNDVLHLAYRDNDSAGTGEARLQVYSQSDQPTNPVVASWCTPVWHGNGAGFIEGNGGTGILEDGRAVAVVYLGANQDNMGADPRNFSRIREVGTLGTWSAWEEVFPGDSRGLGHNLGYAGETGFAPDGFGGLFMAYGKTAVIHWDPETEDWYDVFTNLPGGDETLEVGPIVTVPAPWPDLSTVYYHCRKTRELYVGHYLQHEPPPTGIVLIIE